MRLKKESAAMPIPTERQEQRALVKYLSLHHLLRDCFCKNNNEGKRTPLQGMNLKREGLRPGVLDIFIYYPHGKFHGLWIEMKQNRKYTPSEQRTRTWIAQEEFMVIVKKLGYSAHFCYGAGDAVKIIDAYLHQ